METTRSETTRIHRRLVPTIMIVCALTWIAYWGANFPAIMTPDSIDQWEQVLTGNYHNWHPIAHTWTMVVCSWIWFSPAASICAQIMFMVVTVGYTMHTLVKIGCSDLMVGSIGAFYAFHPIQGQMLSTVWKDIPFSTAFLGLTVSLIAVSRSTVTVSPPKLLIVILMLYGIALVVLRHNGIVTIAGAIIGGMLATSLPKRRQILTMLMGLILVGLTWPQFIKHRLNIPSAPVTETLAIPLQQVAAIITQDNPSLGEAEMKLLESVAPWSLWSRQTSRSSVDWLKFDPNFDPAPIAAQPEKFAGLWLKLMMAHPATAFKAWMRQTMVIWYPGVDANGTVTSGISTNPREIEPEAWFPLLEKTGHFSRFLLQIAPLNWTVRPAVIHAALIIAGFMLLRHCNHEGLLPFWPSITSTLLLGVMIPTPDFRYFYPLFLVAPILWAHASTRQSRRANTRQAAESRFLAVPRHAHD